MRVSPADNPTACSFRTLMICSSVNLLLRMSVSLENGLYQKSRAIKGSRSARTVLAGAIGRGRRVGGYRGRVGTKADCDQACTRIGMGALSHQRQSVNLFNSQRVNWRRMNRYQTNR